MYELNDPPDARLDPDPLAEEISSWNPDLDAVPDLLQQTAVRALSGRMVSMIRMFCAVCVGYAGFKWLKDCAPCCHLYPFRLGRPDRPGPGGWTAEVCNRCHEVAQGTVPAPTIARFPSAMTIAEAKKGSRCRAGFDVDSTAEKGHMPFHRGQAIALHCAACLGSAAPARECTTTTCWLWPRRGGLVPTTLEQ